MATIGPSKEPICFYNSDPPSIEIYTTYNQYIHLTNNVIKFLRTHSHLICKFPFMELIERGMFLSGMDWCKSLRVRS